jgi:ribosomal-protein-alanine N-acetyltransferase
MPATDPVTLRAARPADLPALLALEAQFPGDRLSPRQLRAHLHNPRARLRVLLDDRTIAGYALVFLRRGSRIARLYSIAVDAAHRGRGHGRALLRDAETAARAAGAQELRLEVRVDNPAAIALYEARGYRRLAALPGYYADGAPGWRYGRRIADPGP